MKHDTAVLADVAMVTAETAAAPTDTARFHSVTSRRTSKKTCTVHTDRGRVIVLLVETVQWFLN